MTKAEKTGLTAQGLRYLAMLFMLLDHIWYTLLRPEAFWLTCVGRLALPIFAFQIAEGYFHTSDFARYAKRLFWFGVVAEIPFDLMVSGQLFYAPSCNVMFTLLLGLLALKAANWASRQAAARKAMGILAALCLYLLGDWLGTDYGSKGVLMVLIFGLAAMLGRNSAAARKYHLDKILQLVGLAAVNCLIGGRIWHGFPIQNLATLSLVIIWLYHGEKGTGGKKLQAFAYRFYPAHMLILALLRQVL